MAIPPLTAEMVDAFIVAPKRAPTAINGAQLHWEQSGRDAAVAVVTIETIDNDRDGPRDGAVRLVAGYDAWRHWTLILVLQDEQVYAWHFKEDGVHTNTSCPTDFPKKVRGPHEHRWVAGHDLTCALPLTFARSRPADLPACLSDFCECISLTLEPAYVGPPVGAQMSILPEAK
jgi:hypothetical protein